VTGDPAGSGENSVRRALLGEMLVAAKVITAEQLTEVLGAPRQPGKKLGQMLIERGWVTEAQLTQTLSLQLSVPWVSLYHIDFSRQLLNRVSRELAEKYCLIPIFVRHVKGQGETLYVAMDDPTNEMALTEVARVAALPTRPMIASASDIRSAIRVYYTDPNAQQQVIDVPAPPTRVEGRFDGPMTTREGRGRVAGDAPATPQVPTQPEAPRARMPSQPPPPPRGRMPSQPPPPPRSQSQPPPPPRAREEQAPTTARSYPPPGGFAEVAAEEVREARKSRPDEERKSRPDESEGTARRRPRMVSLTLLDGTQITLPAKKKEGGTEGLTARDFVSALRATAHGADATEILGEKPQWEPVVAALLSILLRKGLIADWEFVEELRKF
jgi:type IV pilus assembly protein PilB